jgi:hypothetical protein
VISLRDRFAITAMHADLSRDVQGLGDDETKPDLTERAELYYRMANAMCEAREKTKKIAKVHPFRRGTDTKPPEQS